MVQKPCQADECGLYRTLSWFGDWGQHEAIHWWSVLQDRWLQYVRCVAQKMEQLTGQRLFIGWYKVVQHFVYEIDIAVAEYVVLGGFFHDLHTQLTA